MYVYIGGGEGGEGRGGEGVEKERDTQSVSETQADVQTTRLQDLLM